MTRQTINTIILSISLLSFAVACGIVGSIVYIWYQAPPAEVQRIKKIPYKYNPNPPLGGIIESTVRLRSEHGSCSGVVVDEHFILTAGHCLKTESGKMFTSEVVVYDKWGVERGKAKPAGAGSRVDFGILIGDFKNFKYTSIESYKDVFWENGHSFLTCGFAFGQKSESCSVFIPISPDMFKIKGLATLQPGMSGGPVIDLLTGKVVGVNSEVDRGYVSIVPVMGILGAFGIEP